MAKSNALKDYPLHYEDMKPKSMDNIKKQVNPNMVHHAMVTSKPRKNTVTKTLKAYVGYAKQVIEQ